MDSDILQIYNSSSFKSNASLVYMDNDVAYVEDIRELPQLQSNVQFEMNIFLYCDQGRIEAKANGHDFSIRENQIFICPSSLTLSDYMVSTDLRCRVVCITDRLLRSLLRGRMDIWNRAVFLDRLNIVDITNPDIAKVADDYYRLIKYRIDHPEYMYQKEIINVLLQAIVIDFCGFFLMQMHEAPEPDTTDNAGKVCNRFLVLLSGTAAKKQSVGYYAQQLCLTPKYLSKLCKKASGKSAHEWIDEAVKEDIMHALRDPGLTIKEIVSDLGFGTTSFFGKYVKEQFGLTPLQLREQLLRRDA